MSSRTLNAELNDFAPYLDLIRPPAQLGTWGYVGYVVVYPDTYRYAYRYAYPSRT